MGMGGMGRIGMGDSPSIRILHDISVMNCFDIELVWVSLSRCNQGRT